MTTDARTQANQANSQLSTGPRTPEGKARSAQNARKHGLTARDLVILPGEHEDFEDLLAQLTVELSPVGALEQIAFNTVVHDAWTLRRCHRAEAELAVNGIDPLLDDASAKKLDRILRYAAHAERSYYKALRELEKLQTRRAVDTAPGLLEPAVQNEPAPCADAPAVKEKLLKRTHQELDEMLLALDNEAELLGRQAMERSLAELAVKTHTRSAR